MSLNGLFIGIGAGLAYSLSAWGKKEGQTFDWNKFGITMGLGITAGIVNYFVDMPVDAAYSFVINTGGIVLLENVGKLLYRRLIIPIKNKMFPEDIPVQPPTPPIA